MRHGKKFNHLGRKTAHRKAMLSNMACSLIQHKSINTTVAKAKALRKYVEPIITRSKTDSTHSRRLVFRYLQDKNTVAELFSGVAPKIADRPGGYTRIIRTGYRLGDNAEMCMIELVDFNEIYSNEKAKKTTRRSRRGNSGAATTAEAAVETVEEVVETKAAAKADNLTKIEGIGPKIASVLTEAGLDTFKAVSESTPEAIKEILSAHKTLASKDPSTWTEQAKLASEGKWDELKKWQDELDGGKPADSKK